MAPQTIYHTTSLPSASLVNTSVWTFLFRDDRYPLAANDPAFIDAATRESVTRRELKYLTLALAHGLTHRLEALGGPKLRPGATVLIFSPNTIHFPVLLFGAIAAGLKCSLANTGYTPHELRHQFLDSQAEAVLVHPDLVDVVVEMLGTAGDAGLKRMIVVAMYDKHAEFVSLGDLTTHEILGREVEFENEKADETVILCYSSGTTGLSKGVEVGTIRTCAFSVEYGLSLLQTTHRNITSNLLMLEGMCTWMTHGKDRVSCILINSQRLLIVPALRYSRSCRSITSMVPLLEQSSIN